MPSHWRAFQESDIELLLTLDKKVYPTDDPLSRDSVALWYKEDPSFGIVFYDSEQPTEITGILSCIPLNSAGWEELITYNVSEAGIMQKHLYSESRHKEMGVHIYHIERLPGWGKQECFHVAAFGALNCVLEEYKKRDAKFTVCGMSGLCTSKSGVYVFGTILSFRERSSFICTEHIYQALPPEEPYLIVCDCKSPMEDNIEGFKHITRCKMFVLRCGEESRVWTYKIDEKIKRLG